MNALWYRWAIVLSLVGWAGPTFGAGWWTTQSPLEHIDALLSEKKVDAAWEVLRSHSAKMQPKQVEIGRAMLRHYEGKHVDALDLFDSALGEGNCSESSASSKECALASLYRARALMALMRWDEAVMAVEKALLYHDYPVQMLLGLDAFVPLLGRPDWTALLSAIREREASVSERLTARLQHLEEGVLELGSTMKRINGRVVYLFQLTGSVWFRVGLYLLLSFFLANGLYMLNVAQHPWTVRIAVLMLAPFWVMSSLTISLGRYTDYITICWSWLFVFGVSVLGYYRSRLSRAKRAE